MKKLREILKYPAMWRRSHGFGVHSPFAYHFITKVIGERKAVYYAYAKISAFCPKSRKSGFNEIFAGRDMSIPEGQLIFRVLCYFNPEEIIEIGHGHEVTNVILRNAVPRAKTKFFHSGKSITPEPTGEPVVIANQCSNEEAEETMELLRNLVASRDIVLIMRNLHSVPAFASIWREILDATPFGMSFTDGYTGIFVARRKLPRTDYEVFM